MLDTIGAGSVEDLFAGVPVAVRRKRPLDLPASAASMKRQRRAIRG